MQDTFLFFSRILNSNTPWIIELHTFEKSATVSTVCTKVNLLNLLKWATDLMDYWKNY